MKRVKKVKRARKLSVRQMLNKIDSWLCGEHGQDLGRVLSALRGPDRDETYEAKAHTTVHIRKAAFPKLARKEKDGDWKNSANQLWTMNSDYPFQPSKGYDVSVHFAGHIEEAAEVLGLKEQV